MVAVKCQEYPHDNVKQGLDQPRMLSPDVYQIRWGETDSVIKQLKVGAIKAFLIGELLSQGQNLGRETDKSATNPYWINGFPIIPRAIKPFGGGNYWWCNGNRYSITVLLPGRCADYHQVKDLQATIRTMKDFHCFSKALINNNRRWSFLRFDCASEWLKRIREMTICREIAIRLKDNWSKQFLECWRGFYNQAWESLLELQQLQSSDKELISGNQRDVLCYHDWAYHNIIINSGIAYLIDFDYMIVDGAVHDRTNLIGRYLRLNRWSIEALFRILWNFDRFYEWKSGELHWLRTFLTFPYEYWMLGRQYFIEKQPWSIKYYQDQWDRKITFETERRRVLEMIRHLE